MRKRITLTLWQRLHQTIRPGPLDSEDRGRDKQRQRLRSKQGVENLPKLRENLSAIKQQLSEHPTGHSAEVY
jgi:hypothetical protein